MLGYHENGGEKKQAGIHVERSFLGSSFMKAHQTLATRKKIVQHLLRKYRYNQPVRKNRTLYIAAQVFNAETICNCDSMRVIVTVLF